MMLSRPTRDRGDAPTVQTTHDTRIDATADIRADTHQQRGRIGAPWRHSPWTVAGFVAVVYVLWVTAYFVTGHEIRDFIVIGRTAILRSHASAAIQYDPRYTYRDPFGYDGQYSYFLALDPENAHAYMDYPAYRYTRIVYPMLARLAALGQPALVPYALLVVNLLAVVLGTLALAAWLRRQCLSPWLALLYALSPGIFIATAGDLTEPLAYALVICALYLLDNGGPRAFVAACGCFALAALTRETTAVFPVVYAAIGFLGPYLRRVATGKGHSASVSGDLRYNVHAPGYADEAVLRTRRPATTMEANWRGALLLVGSLVPLLLYKLFLLAWLGSAGLPAQVRFELVPFAGLAAYWPWRGFQYVEVENVVLPALICAGVTVAALIRLRHARWEPVVWALLANVLLFVVLLPASSYVDQFASTRIATGVLLAALLCLPTFDALTRGRRTWLLAAGALWLALLPLQAFGMLLSR